MGDAASGSAPRQVGHELGSLWGVHVSDRQLDATGETQVGCAHRKARESEVDRVGRARRPSESQHAGGMRPRKRILGEMGLQHG